MSNEAPPKQRPPREECARISEEDLWRIFTENSDSEFFIRIRNVFLLAAPPDQRRLPGAGPTFPPIPEGEELNRHLGLLIADNEASFEAIGIKEVYNGYRFNPTELTAYFVSLHLNYIRDIICIDRSMQSAGLTAAITKRFAAVLAVGIAAVSEQIILALAALTLLTSLRATKHALCTMGNKAVIDSIIDPNSCFERTDDGHWKAKADAAVPKRPYLILGVILLLIVTISVFLILSFRT